MIDAETKKEISRSADELKSALEQTEIDSCTVDILDSLMNDIADGAKAYMRGISTYISVLVSTGKVSGRIEQFVNIAQLMLVTNRIGLIGFIDHMSDQLVDKESSLYKSKTADIMAVTAKMHGLVDENPGAISPANFEAILRREVKDKDTLDGILGMVKIVDRVKSVIAKMEAPCPAPVEIIGAASALLAKKGGDLSDEEVLHAIHFVTVKVAEGLENRKSEDADEESDDLQQSDAPLTEQGDLPWVE